MTPDTRPSALYNTAAGFEAVLDGVCGRLEDKQVEFSIRRLRELGIRLELMEQELDAFILGKADSAADGSGAESVPKVETAPITRNAE
jgi:hypothetical protein